MSKQKSAEYGVSVDGGETFKGFYGSRTTAIYFNSAATWEKITNDFVPHMIPNNPQPVYTARAQALDLQKIASETVDIESTHDIEQKCQETIFDFVGKAVKDNPPGELDYLRILLQNAVQKWLEEYPPDCFQAVDVQYHTADQVKHVLQGNKLPETYNNNVWVPENGGF